MFDSAASVDALQSARAALRLAERRVGVRSQDETVPDLPAVEQSLAAGLLPGGALPQGAVVNVLGSAYLTAWLLGATQGEGWIAVVGWPELNAGALAESGVALEHVVVVPDTRGHAAEAIAALLVGVDAVVVGKRAAVTAADRRRLLARARERGTTLIATTAWENSAMGLRVDRARWGGINHGDGWLREVTLTVRRRTQADERLFEVFRNGDGEITVRLASEDVARRPRLAAV